MSKYVAAIDLRNSDVYLLHVFNHDGRAVAADQVEH
jgi:hypothetical protein